MKLLITLLALATLSLSTRFLHETRITIISPKVNAMYKKGQTVDIHFTLRCEEKLKNAAYTITDQDNKVLFTKKPNVAGKTTFEEKTTWVVTQNDPSVLTLSIEAEDADGHGSIKVLQFNANF